MKNKKVMINISLMAIVVLLVVTPLALLKNAEFLGADGQGGDAIMEIAPDYEPWADHIFVPASGEIETLFFTLQAALGAGFIGYYFGTLKGRKKKNDTTS